MTHQGPNTLAFLSENIENQSEEKVDPLVVRFCRKKFQCMCLYFIMMIGIINFLYQCIQSPHIEQFVNSQMKFLNFFSNNTKICNCTTT